VRIPARIIPYPTGRLFWVGAVPGTFVPGYDRIVPLGHYSSLRVTQALRAWLTISLSLRDKSHSPIEGPRIKLALMGLKPRAELYSPFGFGAGRFLGVKTASPCSFSQQRRSAGQEIGYRLGNLI
jgi:hypothetical protein